MSTPDSYAQPGPGRHGPATRPAYSEESGGAWTEGVVELPTGPRFQRGGELGSGGMGRVVLIHDNWLGRVVALKEPVTAHDARRLAREAQVTARLEHPGIVPIYDMGRAPSGQPWFAMRLVHGRSLAEVLAATPDLAGRLRLVRNLQAAAEAVGFAHRQGVVHRDLKPANIMVGNFGETLVIDWGLALAPDTPLADPGRSGTPGYMSPEQTREERTTPASDVWSFGVILREILEVGAGSANAPPALLAIATQALAIDPADRYPDAKALADDLESWLEGRRVAAHLYRPSELLYRLIQAWRAPLMVAALALTLIVVLVVLGVTRLSRERTRADTSLAMALVTEAQRALQVDARPEAEVLAVHALAKVNAFSTGAVPARLAAEARGVLATVAGARPTREQATILPCTATDVVGDRALCADPGGLTLVDAGVVRWQIDLPNHGALFLDAGRAIAVTQHETLRILDATTGLELVPPLHDAPKYRLEHAGDGRSVIAFGVSHLVRLRVDGATPFPERPCADVGNHVGTLDATGERWAATCLDGALVVGDFVGGARQRFDANLGVLPSGPQPASLAFVGPDLVVVGDTLGTLTFVPLDGSPLHRLATASGLVRLVVADRNGVRFAIVGEHGGPAIFDARRQVALARLPDRGGRALAFSDDDSLVTAGSTLERWRVDQLQPRALPLKPGISALAASSDGMRLAVAAADELVVVDVAARAVLDKTSWQSHIVKTLDFAPDGTLAAHGLGAFEVLRFAGARRLASYRTPERRVWRRLVALADGTTLVADYQPVVYRLRVDDAPVVVLEVWVDDMVASLDGREVAVLGRDGSLFSGHDVHLGGVLAAIGVERGARAVAVSNGGRVVVATPASVIEWSDSGFVHVAEGAELVSVAASPGLVAAGASDGAVWIWRATDSEPWLVLHDRTARVAALAFAPDGSWLASGDWGGRLAIFDLSSFARDPQAADIEQAWALDFDQALGHRFGVDQIPR